MLETSNDMPDLAARVRVAFVERDLDAFGALLSDDVRWGDDNHPRRCRSRSDVVATFQRVIAEGAEADIAELSAGTKGILCGISVQLLGTEGNSQERMLFHVYVVRDNEIIEIERFDERDSAAHAAGVA